MDTNLKNIGIGVLFVLIVLLCIYLAVDSYRCPGCGQFADKEVVNTVHDKDQVYYDKISKKYVKTSVNSDGKAKIRETTTFTYRCKKCKHEWTEKKVDIRNKTMID